MLKENLISSLKPNSVNPPIEPPDTEHNWIIRELTSQNVATVPEGISADDVSDLQYLGFSESLGFGQPFPDLKECYLNFKTPGFTTSASLTYFAILNQNWFTYDNYGVISVISILAHAAGIISETDESYVPPPYYIAYTLD